MMAQTSKTAIIQKLFLEHTAALRGFLFGLLGNREATNDVFQELFLTVTKCAEQFRPNGNFLPWARGIARNLVLEYYRKNRHLPRQFDEELLSLLAAVGGQRNDEWDERRAALATCIQQLAPRSRQILDLRYADQPASPPEIAKRLSWSVNAVHVALARARRFLRDCTRRQLTGGEV